MNAYRKIEKLKKKYEKEANLDEKDDDRRTQYQEICEQVALDLDKVLSELSD